MKVNIKRIQKDIETLAQFTSTPSLGITRLPYTPEDKKARKYIRQQMAEAGLVVREDGVGTIIGRIEGNALDAPAIMIGSHYDSVKNGGLFDGVAGVVAAMEVARLIKAQALALKNPIEVLAFNDEEGVRFNTGMTSSRAMVGLLSEEELDKAVDENKTSLREAMADFGIRPDLEKTVRKKSEVKAFLELHIEQGPVLESNNKDIGIVENIVGLAAYKVIIEGRAGHAGTTPMDLRSDALIAACEATTFIHDKVRHINKDMVATVGEMKISPNASNVIPGRVEFTIDTRSITGQNIEAIEEKMREKLKELEEKHGVKTQITKSFYGKPVALSRELIEIFQAETKDLGYSFLKMNSGAGHDSMIMANFTETGMIFVPSKNGVSHTPEEWTDYEALGKGVEVLFKTVIKLTEDS